MWTIHAAVEAIRQGKLSPVDLLDECLARIDRYDSKVRAWVFVDRDGARAQVRAALPAGWKVADKTGTGDYGSANDVGVIWPPDGGHPIALTILTTHDTSDAKSDEDLIAAAARIAIAALH